MIIVSNTTPIISLAAPMNLLSRHLRHIYNPTKSIVLKMRLVYINPKKPLTNVYPNYQEPPQLNKPSGISELIIYFIYIASLKKGTVGKNSHDKATITTSWGTRIPNDGNNISTGGSVTVLEPDYTD